MVGVIASNGVQIIVKFIIVFMVIGSQDARTVILSIIYLLVTMLLRHLCRPDDC